MNGYTLHPSASGLLIVAVQVPPPELWLPPGYLNTLRVEVANNLLRRGTMDEFLPSVLRSGALLRNFVLRNLNHPNMHLSPESIEREIGGVVGWPPLHVVADDVSAEIAALPETP